MRVTGESIAGLRTCKANTYSDIAC